MLTPHQIQRFGYIPDRLDPRDRLLRPEIGQPVPRVYSTRAKQPAVYDQGALGSCTANAIAGAMEFEDMRQGRAPACPSRLYIYWHERFIEGTVTSDSGAQIRDGIKVVAQLGAPPETDWPYDIGRFRERPPQVAEADAAKRKAIRYYRNPLDPRHVKWAIANSYPVIFGFTVYASFESPEVAQSGMVPLPAVDDVPIGGHAVVAVGYDDIRQLMEVRNSWGGGWGDSGYCWMPYAYFYDRNQVSDLWTIRQES